MNIWLYRSVAIAIFLIASGCDFLEVDRCLDRGGSWDEDANECSMDEEELGKGLDLLTVLVAEPQTFQGKRVTLSGILTAPDLLCSQYDPEQCLKVMLKDVNVGRRIVVSGIFGPPNSVEARAHLDEVQIVEILEPD